MQTNNVVRRDKDAGLYGMGGWPKEKRDWIGISRGSHEHVQASRVLDCYYMCCC